METTFDKIKIRKITKWMIGVVTACILIYLAIRHIDMIAMGIAWLIHAWFPEKTGVHLVHIVSVCNRSFRNFIVGQATEAVILGTLCTIGMLILRLPYAPMIGALVGVTALVPVVGAFIGTIAGAFLILTVSPLKAFIFVAYLMILQQIEGNLIYPKVVGSKINLPAIWVLAAVTVGGNLAGPFGMLLGVPAASAAYELLKEATVKREFQSSHFRHDQLEE